MPQTLEIFYQTKGYKGAANNSQGVGEFQGEPAYLPSDLVSFSKNVAINIAAPTIVGPFDTSNPSAESSLVRQLRHHSNEVFVCVWRKHRGCSPASSWSCLLDRA